MDTQTRITADRRPRQSFMEPGELALLRRGVIRVSQTRLVTQLINPNTGFPIAECTLSLYESGARPTPLWVAQRVMDLAASARSYDARHPAP
jgi:hypothetical protein